jgi:hypothetical protein
MTRRAKKDIVITGLVVLTFLGAWQLCLMAIGGAA